MLNAHNNQKDVHQISIVDGQIKDIIQNQPDKRLFQLETNAALEGLCDYLKKQGWSDIEIDYLTKELFEMVENHIDKWV